MPDLRKKKYCPRVARGAPEKIVAYNCWGPQSGMYISQRVQGDELAGLKVPVWVSN